MQQFRLVATAVLIALGFACARPTRADQATLAEGDGQYDPAVHMLRAPFSSPGYHTTLSGGDVHRTRESLGYAVALLRTDDPARHARAADILRAVIALQDKDPASKTCGDWPWFLEEPLARMSPPDLNWADFCGRYLLEARLAGAGKLPADVLGQLDDAAQRAARAIQRRNVGPGYTNIAILGSYVTLVAGETYHLPDLKDYALSCLKRLDEHTTRNGGFTEYNSPTYTLLALEALGELRRDSHSPEARPMIDRLYRAAWEEVAQHFHVPTRQWAGPHSRAYATLVDPKLLSLIEDATAGRVDFGVPPRADPALPLPCPSELEHDFRDVPDGRMLVKTFVRGDAPIVGSTVLDRAFALGSVNHAEMWDQRRPLVGYWGDPQHPSWVRVRFLHDGHDFSAAELFSVQQNGRVLAAISFATDGGDKHINLDRLRKGTITASDLRLRFEFGGAAGAEDLGAATDDSGWWRRRFGQVWISAIVPSAEFAGQPIERKTGHATEPRDGRTAYLDYLLYHGVARPFDLRQMERAYVTLALEMSVAEPGSAAPVATLEQGRVRVDWAGLNLAAPVRPAPAKALLRMAPRPGDER